MTSKHGNYLMANIKFRNHSQYKKDRMITDITNVLIGVVLIGIILAFTYKLKYIKDERLNKEVDKYTKYKNMLGR